MRMMHTFAAVALSPFLLVTAQTTSAQAGLDLSAGPAAVVLEVALGPVGNFQEMGGLDCDLRASRDLECKGFQQRLGERGEQVSVTYRFRRWPHDLKYDLILDLTDFRGTGDSISLISNVPNSYLVEHEGLTGPQLIEGVMLDALTSYDQPASVIVRAVPVDPVWREAWAEGHDAPQVPGGARAQPAEAAEPDGERPWWQRLFRIGGGQ